MPRHFPAGVRLYDMLFDGAETTSVRCPSMRAARALKRGSPAFDRRGWICRR